MNKKINVMYLHGFASGPECTKANFFKKKLEIHGLNLVVPDLNVPDFEHLSLQKMVNKVKMIISENKPGDWYIICSSLGAVVSIIASRTEEAIKRIVMLSPAFGFCDRRNSLLGENELQKWETEGIINVYHHGYNKNIPIDYSFMLEIEKEDEYELKREIPIKIFHGAFDTTVPFEYVEKFVINRKNTNFHLLESDHLMHNKMDWIWREIMEFLPLKKL